MKLIIICGPTGSGKTTLSKKILKTLKNGIILHTDNYYKTGIFSRILSKIIPFYFDKKISFNYKLFIRHLEFILKYRISNFSYKYNYKSKSITKIYKRTKNLRYVIVEGIFGQEISKSIKINNCILINLQINKQTCMKRAIQRDLIERGKRKDIAKRDFIKAWQLFYKNTKKNNTSNYSKKIVIRNQNDINLLLKNIISIVN